jgi:hypothetical protein
VSLAILQFGSVRSCSRPVSETQSWLAAEDAATHIGGSEMLNQISDLSQRNAALIAGFALLLMLVLAPVGYMVIIEGILVPGDAVATTEQILASEGRFRVGIGLMLANAALDLIAAWALYVLLKPVRKSAALLAAWFRITYTTMLVVALGHLLGAVRLLGADFLAALGPGQLQAQVMLSVNAFHNVWDVSYVLFGLHLAVLGYVALKASFLPKFLGILLFIAGGGYLFDTIGTVLFANYNLDIALYTFIGEVVLIVWLLLRGFRGFPAVQHERK